MTPSPRVAIVTGGARGIGRACVASLAGEAFAVVVRCSDLRGQDAGGQVVRANGGIG